MPLFTYKGVTKERREAVIEGFKKDYKTGILFRSTDRKIEIAQKNKQREAEKKTRFKELEDGLMVEDAKLIMGVPNRDPVVFPKGEPVEVAKSSSIYNRCLHKSGFNPDGTEAGPENYPAGKSMVLMSEAEEKEYLKAKKGK